MFVLRCKTVRGGIIEYREFFLKIATLSSLNPEAATAHGAERVGTLDMFLLFRVGSDDKPSSALSILRLSQPR